MYNGHEFNAYDVLGLPAGANSEMIDNAYKKLKAEIDESQEVFLETAYKALKQK